MNLFLSIVCGSFALWGLVYVVLGIVGKVRHQAFTGSAVILLAASMPILVRYTVLGWALIIIAVALAAAALRIRFRELPARKS